MISKLLNFLGIGSRGPKQSSLEIVFPSHLGLKDAKVFLLGVARDLQYSNNTLSDLKLSSAEPGTLEEARQAELFETVEKFLPRTLTDLVVEHVFANTTSRLVSLIKSARKLENLVLTSHDLTPDAVDCLIDAIKFNTHLRSVNIEGCSQEQQKRIDFELYTNQLAGKLAKDNLEGKTLNLETCKMNNDDGYALAKFISLNHQPTKHIKTTSAHFSQEAIARIIQALEKNTAITQFTFNYKNATAEQKRQIKTQLMLNKIKRKAFLAYGSAFNNMLAASMVFVAAFTQILPTLVGIFIAANFTFHATLDRWQKRWFQSAFELAKNNNYYYSPEQFSSGHAKEIELGKECVDKYLSYCDPRAWTPLAHIAFAIEKNKKTLQENYGLQQERAPSFVAKPCPK